MNVNVPFAIVLGLALVAFVASCIGRFRLVALGTKDLRIDQPVTRFVNMLQYAFGQKRVVSYRFGLNHFVIFWSFLVLLLANTEFLLNGIFPHIGIHSLPTPLYVGLAFLFDVVSLITLVVIGIAVARRLLFPPDYIEARSRDAFIILGMIAGLMVAFFISHAAQILITDPAGEPFRPISNWLADYLPAGSVTPIYYTFWWAHALILLAFLNYLPYSKHMHILTAIPNCFFRSLTKVNVLPRETFGPGQRYGAATVAQFTWKDLFDSYSCTECGRCQHVCPATNTQKPLNPKQVVHELKMNLLANGPEIASGRQPRLPLIGIKDAEGTVSEDSIWSCTSCGACLQVCPVFIEQMPKILKMRRHLVEMEAKFPEELLNLFENMEQRSNPWGIAPSERTKWCSGIDAKPFGADTEYLLYVGCAGAFDSRNRQVTLALTRVLDAAGISWGILGKDEKCCGDSLRRLGNEYVFEQMAQENVKLFQERGVTKVITQCPHCFSTLKNDYAQYGAEFEVIHHTELISQLIAQGKLPVQAQAAAGKAVFHDSCYLGRHNDVYDAPRQAIAAATGQAPAEMERNRDNAFCCGAGGGRMWMEEHLGTRINLTRVREALEQKPDTICTACPYCMTMFEDGLKDEGAEQVQVKDVAEVVADALAETKTPAGV